MDPADLESGQTTDTVDRVRMDVAAVRALARGAVNPTLPPVSLRQEVGASRKPLVGSVVNGCKWLIWRLIRTPVEDALDQVSRRLITIEARLDQLERDRGDAMPRGRDDHGPP